jgi:uncharacterized tellurite resistance protein B-like protein
MNDDFSKGLSETVHTIFAQNEQYVRQAEKLVFQGKKSTAPKADVEFALTLLLVELASADNDFAPEEYNMIVRGLEKVFGTSRQQTTALIERAKTTLSNFRGTTEFAELLRQHTNEEERKIILTVIDDVMNADGIQDGFEIYHRHRFASLLGVSPSAAKAEDT